MATCEHVTDQRILELRASLHFKFILEIVGAAICILYIFTCAAICIQYIFACKV